MLARNARPEEPFSALSHCLRVLRVKSLAQRRLKCRSLDSLRSLGMTANGVRVG